MKETGVIRKLDALGRIVIPREFRKRNHIEVGDPVEMHAMQNGDIVLRKVDTAARLRPAALRAAASLSAVTKSAIGVCTQNAWVVAPEKLAAKEEACAKLVALAVHSRRTRVRGEEVDLPYAELSVYPLCEDESTFGALVCIGAASDAEDAALRVAADMLVQCACNY